MEDPPLTVAQRESGLLDALVQLADTLVSDYDVVDLLHELVSHCMRLFDVAAAGIMLSGQQGNLQVLASSTQRTRMLELYEVQANEGPCWDCVRSGEPVAAADLVAAGNEWPLFSPAARDLGFRSVQAIPMRLRFETIGALNLFGAETRLMLEQDKRAARALADAATIGILQQRSIERSEVLTEQLQLALTNRVLIEQAKGILAQAGNLDMDQAFETLSAYGRRRSTRLAETARRLADGVIDPEVILTEQSSSVR